MLDVRGRGDSRGRWVGSRAWVGRLGRPAHAVLGVPRAQTGALRRTLAEEEVLAVEGPLPLVQLDRRLGAGSAGVARGGRSRPALVDKPQRNGLVDLERLAVA